MGLRRLSSCLAAPMDRGGTGGLRGPAGLREPGLHLHGHERRSVDEQRRLRRCDELGHGLRAAALRLQHAHRDQHLRLLGRSLPDEELGGLEQAADFQQPEREGLHQCGLSMINDEALVQTKSLSMQLSLTTNERNSGCLVQKNWLIRLRILVERKKIWLLGIVQAPSELTGKKRFRGIAQAGGKFPPPARLLF